MRIDAADNLLPVILLVEDNPGDVLLMQEAFEHSGVACQVQVAKDGAAALAMLQRRAPYENYPHPDLILLDINLPKISGHEVLARIKQDLQLRRIPVVVLSSSDAHQDVVKSYDLQASAHLCKPSDYRQYVDMICSIERFWLGVTLRQVAQQRKSKVTISRFLSHTLESSEVEQRRIARDLHDGIGQTITSMRLVLQAASQAGSLAAAQTTIQELKAMLVAAQDEVRRIVRGLRPSVLDDLGLFAALERLAKEVGDQFGLQVELQEAGLWEKRLPEAVESALYRVAQESLTNITRHAAAQRVEIRLDRQLQGIQLTVQDDGRGFDPVQMKHLDSQGGLGLTGMRERMLLAGGAFNVKSTLGEGTLISAYLPMEV